MKPLARRAQSIHRRLLTVYGEPTWRRPLPPLDELVSTILSQNTNDTNRDRAFDALCARFPTWEAVRDAPSRSVTSAIRPAGLANQKGPRLQQVLRQVTAERGALDLEFLRSLPPEEARQWLLRFRGVGPKTAAIVLLFSLDLAAFPVDTHIHRVTGRLGLRPPRMTADQAHPWLAALFAPETYKAAHLNLIRLGREVCAARRPACERCPVSRSCDYFKTVDRGRWSVVGGRERLGKTTPPTHPRPPSTGLPWHRLAGLSTLAFAIGFVINTIEPAILGHRTLELAPEAKNTVLGLLTFVGVLVAMAWQPIVGDLSDRTRSRWGRRIPFFVGGVGSMVISLLWIAVAPGLLGVLLSLLLLQVAWNSVQSPSQALIPDHVPHGQRGAAAGWKSALEILAFVAGRQVSSRLVAEDRILAAAVVASLVAVLCLGIVLRLARETGSEGSFPGLDLRKTFALDRRRNPAFVPWFVNRVLVWGGFIALSTFLLFFVIDVLGLSEANAQRFVGNVSTLMGLGLLLVAVPAGWLADRIGRRRLVATSGVLAAVGTGLLIAWPTTTTALAAGAILGLAVGVFLTTSWALATQIVPGVEAARMLGLANVATAGGSAIARLTGGLIIDPISRLTGDPTSGYFVLFALAGLAFVAGTFVILRMPPEESGPQ